MYSLLVADVGGTNVRFAICTDWLNCPDSLTHQRTYRCSEFGNFESALKAFQSTLTNALPKVACIAIAGPIIGDLLKLTNLDWQFSISSIKKSFGFSSLEIINDFEAQAYATTVLNSEQIYVLHDGINRHHAPRAIIGPGTGLGIAGLNWTDRGWQACPGEGGHMSFAPCNDQDLAIFSVLRNRFEHVSLEHLLSGPGLVNIYEAFAKLDKKNIDALSTEQVIQHALDSEDRLCTRAILQFLDILAITAGDVALIYGAKGGVYLGGGLIEPLLPFIKNERFATRFINKGVRAQYLRSIPVYIMLHPCPGLVGAAIAYQRERNITEFTSVEYQAYER